MTVPIVAVGGVHAAGLARLHARCFTDGWVESAWNALLATPGCFGFADARLSTGAILCRSGGGDCDVLTVGVVPARRCRGFGSRLLTAAVVAATASGAERMVLEVAEDNGPARHLYAAAGFDEVGRRPKYYNRGSDSAVDALLLSLPLTRPMPCGS